MSEAVKPEAKPFDFGSFVETQDAMEKGKEFEILSDMGRQTGVFFTLYGVSSSKFRMGQRELQTRRMSKEAIDATVDEHTRVKEDDALGYSFCIGGWRTLRRDKDGKPVGDSEPVIYLNGEKLTFSRENAERILIISDYLRGQIKIRVENTAGFTTA